MALVHTEVRATPWGTLTGGRIVPSDAALRCPGAPAAPGVAGRGPGVERPFVGRERELALLHHHLTTAMGGQGQEIWTGWGTRHRQDRTPGRILPPRAGNQVTV